MRKTKEAICEGINMRFKQDIWVCCFKHEGAQSTGSSKCPIRAILYAIENISRVYPQIATVYTGTLGIRAELGIQAYSRDLLRAREPAPGGLRVNYRKEGKFR